MQTQSSDQILSTASKDSRLPGSRFIFFLSLCSIAGCWIYGIGGLLAGIYSLKLIKKALLIHNHKNTYSEKSIRFIKAGRIYSIIGVTLSTIYILMLLIKIIA